MESKQTSNAEQSPGSLQRPGSAAATPRFQKAYLECLDDTGGITRLEPLYGFAKQMELENRALREGCSKIATSIGNGSAASPNASVDFLTNALASEVKLYCAAQRAEIEYLREQVKRAAAQPNSVYTPTDSYNENQPRTKSTHAKPRA